VRWNFFMLCVYKISSGMWRLNSFVNQPICRSYDQNIPICFIVLLGLVFMGRHKCEVVACLSSQVKYDLYELLYCLLYLWRINLIWFDLKSQVYCCFDSQCRNVMRLSKVLLRQFLRVPFSKAGHSFVFKGQWDHRMQDGTVLFQV